MGQTFAIQCIAQFAGSTAIQTGHPGMYVLVGHPIFAGAALVFGDLTSPKPPLRRRLLPSDGVMIAQTALIREKAALLCSEICRVCPGWLGST